MSKGKYNTFVFFFFSSYFCDPFGAVPTLLSQDWSSRNHIQPPKPRKAADSIL